MVGTLLRYLQAEKQLLITSSSSAKPKGPLMFRLVHRLVATFIYNAGAIIPAASVLGGWPVWKAALTAGVSASVEFLVVEARKYLEATRTTP